MIIHIKEDKNLTLEIFEFVAWSDWSGWSGCSVTCGGGVSRRSRECNDTIGGCKGESQQTESCGETECPCKLQIIGGYS